MEVWRAVKEVAGGEVIDDEGVCVDMIVAAGSIVAACLTVKEPAGVSKDT